METAPARETALADWTASPGGSRTNKRSSSRQPLLFEFHRHPAPHPSVVRPTGSPAGSVRSQPPRSPSNSTLHSPTDTSSHQPYREGRETPSFPRCSRKHRVFRRGTSPPQLPLSVPSAAQASPSQTIYMLRARRNPGRCPNGFWLHHISFQQFRKNFSLLTKCGPKKKSQATSATLDFRGPSASPLAMEGEATRTLHLKGLKEHMQTKLSLQSALPNAFPSATS
jgi:hypothetical protein